MEIELKQTDPGLKWPDMEIYTNIQYKKCAGKFWCDEGRFLCFINLYLHKERLGCFYFSSMFITDHAGHFFKLK